MTFGALLERLQQRDAAALQYDESGLQEELKQTGEKTYPLIARVVIVLGAWFGAGLLSSFLILFLLKGEEPTMLAAGVIFIICSLLLPRAKVMPVALEPFALALSVIGIGLTMTGLDYDLEGSEAPHNLIVAFIELIIVLFTVSRVQRAVGVFGFFSFLALYFYANLESPALVMALILVCALLIAWLHLKEAHILSRDKGLIRFYQPVLSGLCFALPMLLLYTAFRKSLFHHDEDFIGWWPIGVVLALLLLRMLYNVFRETCGFSGAKLISLLLLAALALAPMVKAPGILGGLLLIVCGFSSGNRAASGLGLLSLIVYSVIFYYTMETTLLVKSILMLVSGALLLIAALVFNHLNKQS